MEAYKNPTPDKDKAKKRESFVLIKAAKMDPFKIEIFSKEFLDIMAEVICMPGTKYNSMKEMIEGIEKPITMKIESPVYDALKTIGDAKDIEMVCKYVAVQRIISSVDDNQFAKLMEDVRKALREVPVSTRHVLTTVPQYQGIFALIPAAYLSSVCNLTSVGSDIAKMDKDNARYMTKIMETLKEMTIMEGSTVTDAYSMIMDFTKRILYAYRDHNIIDLANLYKDLNNMMTGELGEYFSKLMTQIKKDMDDSFTAFQKLVRSMKDEDDAEFSKDKPEPYEYDAIEETPEGPPEDLPPDMNNDSILGPDPDAQPTPAAETPPSTTPEAGGVVTGLESVDPMMEGLFGRKKLKRISKAVVGYVKVKGANARDADELTLFVSYGYSQAERCEWYIDIIDREDDRYIVPQTRKDLEWIRDELYKVLDEITKKPFYRHKGSIYQNGIDPY